MRPEADLKWFRGVDCRCDEAVACAYPFPPPSGLPGDLRVGLQPCDDIERADWSDKCLAPKWTEIFGARRSFELLSLFINYHDGFIS